MALTKTHSRMIDGDVINVKDYGAVGDMVTDDTAAIQAAIDAGKTLSRVVFFPAIGAYKITDTIVIPEGMNHIVFEGPNESISGTSESTARGSLVWYGGTNKPAIQVNKQEGSLYSTFDGLSVINSDASTYTGCTGILFRDNTLSGGSYRVKAYNLSVSRFETGFRWGDEEGGDSSGATNIDENRYYGLRAYQCGVPFIFDCTGGDDNTFEGIFFEGSYSAVVSGYTSDKKFWVRKSGTNNVFRDAFIRLDDLAVDETAVIIASGDARFENFNFERATGNCRLLLVESSVSRGQLIFDNVRTPSTSGGSYRNSSGTSVTVNSGSTTIFKGCNFDGNVVCQDPVVGIGCLFTDTYGFSRTGTNEVFEIGTRTRADTASIPSTTTKTLLPSTDFMKTGFSVIQNDNRTGNLSDNVFEGIAEIAVPDDTLIGIKLNYFIYGPNVTNTSRLAERGEFFITIVSDNAGNITSNITKGSFSQALDGYSSLTVSGQLTADAANNKVTVEVKQDNNVGSSSIRGIFDYEITHCLTGGLPSMSLDNITFLTY